MKNIFFIHRNGGYHEKKNFMQSAYRCADRSGNQYCNHNFSSLIYGDGNYYPVVPALVEQCGNEINAVVAQMIASLLYGAVWAGASVIWEMDDWSLLRQTVTHLLAGSIATFPVAYLMYWMKHSIAGVVVYFAIFIGIYVGIWITLYSRAKREVTKLNEKVSLQNR